MLHILELHHKLMEVQGKNSDRIKSYTASARCQKDIENLGRIGLSTEDISYSLDLPLSFIQKEKARIAQISEARRRFLRTGILPSPELVGQPGVFSILRR
jgi:hypothetical protein